MVLNLRPDPASLHCACCMATGCEDYYLFTNVLNGRTELVCQECVDEDQIPSYLVFDDGADQPRKGAG